MRHSFKKHVIDQVWDKLDTIDGENPNQKRIDLKGKVVAKAAYGNETSQYGWNIHHIDHNKDNNLVSNLLAVSYESHRKIHEED